MQPGQWDFELYQGDTYAIEGVLSYNAGTEEAPDIQPIDLTDLTLAAQIRYKTKPGSELVASFECFKLNALTGEFRLELHPDESAKVEKSGFWDFETRTTAEPIVARTWMAGAVTLKNDVTRTS